MALVRWRHLDPWGRAFWDVGRLQREMNRLFDGVLPDYGRRTIEYPPVNVWTRGDDIVVAVEMPGLKPEDIDLSITQTALTIKGARPADTPDEKRTFHRQERLTGSFVKSVQLPDKVDADKAVAAYEHGILTVTLPKAPEAKPKQITVKS